MSNLLSLVTFIPLVAAVILALLARGDSEDSQRNVKYLALAATVFTFVASLMVLFGFDSSNTGFQFVEEHSWLLGMQYKMGVDGISVSVCDADDLHHAFGDCCLVECEPPP